ncbi:MAG TPA: DegT/DnrJ/EryC1/StrS family aminotransferase [Chitinophagales bacterium]|nr:DegT/DnrJ/EryC1/StrS family aminotransferase [Chitinophagales bacterium]
MIPVTKSFLPPLEEYTKLLEGIWERVHLTNNGPLLLELEEKLKNYLGSKHFIFLNNGTSAIQIAIKGLDLKGEIITTPFSYVATTSSIVWENCTPVFADIEESTLTIDANRIEELISPQTSAILATHVYGIPCNIEKIEKLAKKHNLKVIYDAAHAFGVKYNGQALTNFGDASTLSFHATKLFHCTEGGALITNDENAAHRFSYMRNFGHKGQEDFWGLGINAKNSEFHAAMGLCVYKHLEAIIDRRKELSELYDQLLLNQNLPLVRPKMRERTEYNYAYYPVVFEDEKTLLDVRDALNASFIYPRRYFYPSLSELPYVKKHEVPVAESISPRVMCLPLYHDLKTEDVHKICGIIVKILKFK